MDLNTMFGFIATGTRRNDIPADFFDSSVRYALIGNSLTLLTHYNSPNFGGLGYDEDTGMRIVSTTTSSLGYPTISADGRCLIFNGDGSAGNILLASYFNITLPITIDFYAYTKSKTYWPVLNYFTQNNIDVRKIQQGTDSSANRFECRDGVGFSKTIQSPSTIDTQNKWAHLAYVWTTSGTRMYINGNKVAKALGSTADTFYLNTLCLGAKGSSGQYGWNGALYNYRVSNLERYVGNFNVDLEGMPTPI